MAKKTDIGGQAVIEGVMMRGKDKIAVAVRRPDGEIEVNVEYSIPLSKRNKFFSLPVIRGAVSLFDSLAVGLKTLSYSASFYEEEEESSFDRFLKKTFGDRADNIIMSITMLISFAIAIGLFFILPTYTANIIKKVNNNSIVINLLEGIIRLIIFFAYLYLISKMEDIQRVFQYHGAEHKSIFCYENELELTPENAEKFSTLHPRCGTNFLLIVMLVSIFIFSFLGWPNLLYRILSRIIFLPLIAGLSYEILKWFGKTENKYINILIKPGLLLQKLTTREPDRLQLEVAIMALKAVLYEDDAIFDKEKDDISENI
ncbi:Uncharacterized conserved protein YqhQ [Caloramator quimbayensis]|uniref:Uncharacterized conserved protein YqhQ n=1 Tax=Caloramator quimbayensis TaxID=1147123 RepID=A0A1T4WFB8_9CLOT|nr:DUF1385 domain-containing protein [Caloramator quimbayensis]SKA75877.1 Uncharacterized conserved protein YqhQ [Caloramator quimbayensis]